MIPFEKENRQRRTSLDPEERAARTLDVTNLIEGLIGRHKEYFSDPINRIEFLKGQDGESMLRIIKHINARLRGEKPVQLRKYSDEKGGFLSMMHTPSHEDKPESFVEGFDAIQQYLTFSNDPIEKKIQAAAMGLEALIIWVHPCNDGNGRTSRFTAKFIEDGAKDTAALVDETVSARNRPTLYNTLIPTKVELLANANNEEYMYDDDERTALRNKAELAPGDDAQAIRLSVEKILYDDSVRQSILDKAKAHSLVQPKHKVS